MTDSRSRSGCVFCGGSPLSNEHLFPQWVTKLLVDDPRGYPPGKLSHAIVSQGKEISRWESDTPLAFTVHTVCESCNNGWMSNIEYEAKRYLEPIITGSEAVTLDEHALSVVATWMGLRALMRWSTYKHPWPQVVYDWYKWFYTNHTLPPNWCVWIGAYKGLVPAYTESAPFHPFTDKTRTSLRTSDLRGFVFTSVMGYLAFKVVALNKAAVVDQSGSALVRIAPPEATEVEWPPDGLITDDTILKFFGMGLSSESNLAKYWDEFEKSNQ